MVISRRAFLAAGATGLGLAAMGFSQISTSPMAWASETITPVDQAAESAAEFSDGHDTYRVVLINIKSGSVVRTERALRSATNQWYLPADAIEAYTGYTYDAANGMWRRHEDNAMPVNKRVYVFPSQDMVQMQALGTICPVNTWMPEWEGKTYFRIDALLPLLDTVCSVENGMLAIDAPKTVFQDSFYDFDIDAFRFDPDKEFNSEDPIAGALKEVMVGTTYLYDSVSSLRLDRVLGYGGYNDFKAVFSDYLTDNDGYDKLYGTDVAGVAARVENVRKLELPFGLGADAMKVIKAGAEWLDDAMITMGFWESGEFAIEAFDELADSGLFKGADAVGKALGIAATVYDVVKDYYLLVRDNRDAMAWIAPQMIMARRAIDTGFFDEALQAVTGQGSNGSLWIETAARDLCSQFSDERLLKQVESEGKDIARAIVEDSLQSGLDKLVLQTALGLPPVATAAVGLEKFVLDEFFKELGIEASGDMALLNYHLAITQAATEVYETAVSGSAVGWEAEGAWGMDTMAWGKWYGNNLKTLRLAAIMVLLSSKRCFEIIRDNNNYFNTDVSDYCDRRVQRIVDRLPLLYWAGQTQFCDGIEYFQSAQPMLANSLANDLVEVGAQTWVEHWLELSGGMGVLGRAGTYLSCVDLTGDGIPELVVTTYGNDTSVGEGSAEPSSLDVYVLVDDQPVLAGSVGFYVGYREQAFFAVRRDSDGACRLLHSSKAGDSESATLYAFDSSGGMTEEHLTVIDEATGMALDYTAGLTVQAVLLSDLPGAMPGSYSVPDVCPYLEDRYLEIAGEISGDSVGGTAQGVGPIAQAPGYLFAAGTVDQAWEEFYYSLPTTWIGQNYVYFVDLTGSDGYPEMILAHYGTGEPNDALADDAYMMGFDDSCLRVYQMIDGTPCQIWFQSAVWGVEPSTGEDCGFYAELAVSAEGRLGLLTMYYPASSVGNLPLDYEFACDSGVTYEPWSGSGGLTVADRSQTTGGLMPSQAVWDEGHSRYTTVCVLMNTTGNGMGQGSTTIESYQPFPGNLGAPMPEQGTMSGYSDAELCAAAQYYFAMENGYLPDYVVVDNTDGVMAAIKLYNLTADGGEEILEWYFVDRVTLNGTNLLGDYVQL